VQIRRIGILSPGEMGSALARTFLAHGHTVSVALNGRSERTRALASVAGLANVGSIDQLVRRSDLVLSVLVPSAATVAAQQVAAAMRATGSRPIYADCNAIAPQTSRQAGDFITAAGGRFVDGSIIGAPPRNGTVTRLYVSGPDAGELAQIATDQLQVRVLGAQTGEASALKMVYSAFNKGIQGLATELLVAAERLGVDGHLRAELQDTRKATHDWLLSALPEMPPKAHRWVREMEEIGLALESVGLTPKAFEGIADVYRWIADSGPGRVSPAEPVTPKPDGSAVIHRLAQA
jgi:3-hydroxyisobutyrate dehydrogenase-like beta-hydroxyacid dehydrogenase